MRYWVYLNNRLRGGVIVNSKKSVRKIEAKGFVLVPVSGGAPC